MIEREPFRTTTAELAELAYGFTAMLDQVILFQLLKPFGI